MPLAESYAIRKFRANDAPSIAAIMARSIRSIGPNAYSAEQVDAWVARALTAARARERASQGHLIRVAVSDADRPVAYAILERDGHLDHLYCDPDYTRRGLADALLEHAELEARALACRRLYTEASELARPAFERSGYVMTHRRDFSISHGDREVPIHNYAMEKTLG